MITIVYVHPWEGSFAHAIKTRVIDTLTAKGKEYQLIDLYKDQFRPDMQGKDLALFAKGEAADPLVTKYQDMLKVTDELVIICPVWWAAAPAMLKGFFDKVMLKGFAYDEKPAPFGLMLFKGKLTHIKRAYIITTSQAPTLYFKFLAGNYFNRVIGKHILKTMGIGKCKWMNLDKVKNDLSRREKYMDKVAGLFK